MMGAGREQMDKKILAVLTHDQRVKWKTLVGTKFDFGPRP
jgi:hypothetical protein